MANLFTWKRFTPKWGNEDDGTPWTLLVKVRPTIGELKRIQTVLNKRLLSATDNEDIVAEMLEVFRMICKEPRELYLVEEANDGSELKSAVTSMDTLMELIDVTLYNEVFGFISAEKERAEGNVTSSDESSGGDTGMQVDVTVESAAGSKESTPAPDDGGGADAA